MQDVVYKCDNCEKIIGKTKHISLDFGRHSGIAVPPSPQGLTYWDITKRLQNKFMHFCNGKCIGEYFRKLLNPKPNVKS